VSLAKEFGLDVEGVGAVEVDVIVLCRCQVCLVDDGVALGTQRVERGAGDDKFRANLRLQSPAHHARMTPGHPAT
jgi:hypothetical protein